MHDLKGLLVIMVVVWVAGKIFRALNLPVIFGELLGGIIVGPLVLGIVQPGNETIKILAELGIFFLMLHAGLETKPKEMMSASKKSFLVAMGSFLTSFVVVFAFVTFFGNEFNESLFLAMGLSTTAIAIGVRLFKDYKIHNTKTAQIALGAALINDITALVMFSMVLNFIENGEVNMYIFLIFFLKTIIFFAVIIWSGFKLSKYSNKFFRNKGFTLTLIVALSFGLIAELIGLHLIIGAFLAGLFIRQECLDEKIFNKIEDRIYGLSYSFLGPIFFASLALSLDLSIIFANPTFLIGLLVILILAKIFGAGLGARLQKLSYKQSLIIGVAMNSQGALELVIASIGYQKGIIGQELFSALVLIAFLATLSSIVLMKPLAKYAHENNPSHT